MCALLIGIGVVLSTVELLNWCCFGVPEFLE